MHKPSANSPLDAANQLLIQDKYQQAIKEFHACVNNDESDLEALIGLGRCYLGMGQNEQAAQTYQKILSLSSDESSLACHLEAQIVLGQLDEVIQQADNPAAEGEPECLFWLAFAFYLRGHLLSCIEFMEKAAKNAEIWKEEDAKDLALHHFLSVAEYHDLEQIYLDAVEPNEEGIPFPQNRWFSISAPSYELFGSKSEAELTERADKLRNLLMAGSFHQNNRSGKELLGQIISGLSVKGLHSSFSEKAGVLLSEARLPELAEHVLGLELDHLKQFSGYFDLTDQFVMNSKLRDLIEVLPYRIAVGLAFLYMAANPIQGIGSQAVIKLSDDMLARLIAISFTSFYQEIDYYRIMNNGIGINVSK